MSCEIHMIMKISFRSLRAGTAVMPPLRMNLSHPGEPNVGYFVKSPLPLVEAQQGLDAYGKACRKGRDAADRQ